MKHIKIISNSYDYKPMLQQVLENYDDFDFISKTEEHSSYGGSLNPPGFLPLCMGVIDKTKSTIKDSELLRTTPLYSKYTTAHKFWYEWGFKQHSRAAFFRLRPGGRVLSHIDDGTYYVEKDRYHFSLQGTYRYRVGEEEIIVEPGTFFWFNNKLYHEAENIGSEDRITFVFDSPHNLKNPHHKVK